MKLNLRKPDPKKIKKSLIRVGIPLLLVVAVFATLVVMASGGQTKIYRNITSKDYEVPEDDLETVDAPPCVYADFEPVAKDGTLIMYLNRSTSVVAVYDSATGQTVTTAIPEEEIARANPVNAEYGAAMRSNFVLTAVNMETGNTGDYAMYDQLQADGKYSLESIENGVRITYVIGKIPETFVVPQALSDERYWEIVEELDEDDGREFENRFSEVDLSEYFGSDYDAMLKKYPTAEKETVHYLNNNKEYILRKLEDILDGIGYTEEQQKKDESEVLGTVESSEYTVFRIPMEFTLRDGHFSVSVLRDGIRYSSAALPVSIAVCPYLMRGYKTEQGTMLVPDGSGSLINLNNGKTDAKSYAVPVYGTDPVYYQNFETENTLSAALPVCGISTGRGGVFAYLSETEADATVMADVSGKYSDTNFVRADFKLFGYKKEMVTQDWTSTGNGTIYAVRIQGESISGKNTVEYYFLPKNQCAWSDMAAVCRQIMREKGALPKQTVKTEPMLVNLLGSYDYTKSVLGVPVQSAQVMTDCDQAIRIAEELKKADIGFDVRYLSATNGGYRQTVADGLKLAHGVGSKKKLLQLKDAVAGGGGKLYLELSLTAVYENTLFDGFRVSSDSVAKINTKHAAFYDKDPISFYYVKDAHYYLAPGKYTSVMRAVVRDAKKLGADAIALRNCGSVLCSDGDAEDAMMRSDAAQLLGKAVRQATDEKISVMCAGGNAYMLPYSGYVTDIAITSNNFTLTDRAIPFYQMVVHGSVGYTYPALNTSANVTHDLLYSIATGACIQRNVSAESSSLLKMTPYSGYYNTCWEDIGDTVIQEAKLIADAVKATSGKEFLGYTELSDTLTCSEFSDGVKIYVNYSDRDTAVNGITVPAKSYTVQ